MRLARFATTLVVVALVAATELACRLHWIPTAVMIPPSEAFASLVDILRSGRHTDAILTTLANVGLAALISTVGGFVVGVVVHAVPFLRAGLEPYMASYYAVPVFIFYPVFIVLFGVGHAAIVAIAVLMAIVSMITATLNGLDRIPRVLTRTARALRMSPLSSALLVQLPASLPHLFTGMRLSVAYCFIGVIASEFLLSGDGLGYAIAYAYNSFENREMYGLMLLIVLLVTVINMALDAADRRLRARIH